MPVYTTSASALNASDDDDIIPFRNENRNSRVSESRLSRNSVSAADIEYLTADQINDTDSIILGNDSSNNSRLLVIVFVLMLFVGLGNRIFNKLMTIPMYNYPNFLNLLTTFVFIPVCFAYIIPMARNGGIPKEQLQLPKRPFFVMGLLDSIAGIMSIFSATYLPGPLLILLSQAAIPVSMIISRYLLNAKYNVFQYVGAVIVVSGIITVLAPILGGGGNIVWCIVMILSSVPSALSSVYKEIALGETNIDPVYLNGWIAVFQFLMSLILCIPASLATDPPVSVSDLPLNMWQGLKCYAGYNSITCGTDDANCTPDDCHFTGPMFVTVYLIFNQMYNLLIILILKYGSANLLYMVLTLMVPLGNAAFTLPFVPSHTSLKFTDILGLVIICSGLGCFRFGRDLYTRYFAKRYGKEVTAYDRDGSLGGISIKEDKRPLLSKLLESDD